MFVIGLTGGIATGKTLVSETLHALGATVINADLVGHEAYLPHTDTWNTVVDTFGSEILGDDDQIVRSRLGAIVFSDPRKLEQLNAIVHPRIYAIISDRIGALAREGIEVVVVEAALLIEAGWTPLADEVWTVTASRQQVLERLTGRGMSSEQAEARVASQMSQEERITHADVVIVNKSEPKELDQTVRKLWDERIAPRVQGDQEGR